MKLINCLHESLVITTSFDNYGICSDLNKIFYKKRSIYIIREFYENIYYIYKSFRLLDSEDIFRNSIIKTMDTFHQNNVECESINLMSIEALQGIPLNDLYRLTKILDNCNNNNNIFNPFTLGNILKYDHNHDFETLTISNNKYQNKYVCDQQTIRTKDEFINKFKAETGNLFDNFDWTNVIIGGGFVYGLLSQSNNAIIESTDIDIFVQAFTVSEHDEDEIYNEEDPNTLRRMLKHFTKFGGYSLKRGRVITVIIPNYKYDIQIIPTDATSPRDIITKFDWNYVQMYFDGKDIGITFNSLIALKYNIAIYNHENDHKEKTIKVNRPEKPIKVDTLDKIIQVDRLYKTIRKGLDIMIDNKIKCNFIKDDNIKLDKLENYIQNKYKLDKSQIIRKLYNTNTLTEIQFIDLIKYYYVTKNVSKDIINIYNSSNNNESDDYDRFTVINKITPTQIAKVQLIKLTNINQYQLQKIALFDNQNNPIRNLLFEIDYTEFTYCMFDDTVCIKIQLNKEEKRKIKDILLKIQALVPHPKGRARLTITKPYDSNNTISIKLKKNHQHYDKLKNRLQRLSANTIIKIRSSITMYYREGHVEIFSSINLDNFWSKVKYNFI